MKEDVQLICRDCGNVAPLGCQECPGCEGILYEPDHPAVDKWAGVNLELNDFVFVEVDLDDEELEGGPESSEG